MRDRKHALKISILIIFCVALASAVLLTSLSGGEIPQEGNKDYGTYTFQRSMTLASGETVSFFESGDNSFRYYHDSDGFILIRDYQKNTLEYAVNDGTGRPVSSGVSVDADSKKIKSVRKMTFLDINFENNSDLLEVYASVAEVEPLLGSSYVTPSQTEATYITNLVIFIYFKGESVPSSATNIMSNYFNADENSLKNYYDRMSDGTVIITSLAPTSTTGYVYVEAANSRSYYNVTSSSSSERRSKEGELLGAAVSGAQTYLGTSNLDLDVNGDNYVDSVSFIISNSSETTWGGLLWPHSWDLETVLGADKAISLTDVSGQAKKVGSYTFNFTTTLTRGLVCHEMGHVLGAPDLYSYNYDYVAVGNWDLMQFENETPQYMLTYTRNTYICGYYDAAGNYTGGELDPKIKDIGVNGVYSLAPVSSTPSVLAYRIAGKNGEYFMVEYRNPTVADTYDSTLPGAGLIVYRIKENVDGGNKNSKYQSNSNPYEVFVYRPKISVTGNEKNDTLLYNHSKSDINYAALSPENRYFSSIGSLTSSVKYDPQCIYYTDGTNSGIEITALAISASSIEFRVQITSGNAIPNDTFKDKMSIASAGYINGDYAGVAAHITVQNDLQLSALAGIEAGLYDEGNGLIVTNSIDLGAFLTAYKAGTRVFACEFIVSDKGNTINSIFALGSFSGTAPPVTAKLFAIDADGDKIQIDFAEIADNGVTWTSVLNAKTELDAGVAASSRITVGVKSDGTVVASGTLKTGQWGVYGAVNIVGAAAGYTHTLLLSKNLTVTAAGVDYFGETDVHSWSNVRKLAAGEYTSYGLKTDGTVLAAGTAAYGQLAVSGWTNIIAISAGSRHVAGVTAEGKVVAAGDNGSGQCNVSDISGAVQVACGSTFTACLLENGKVVVVGKLDGSTETWSGISKISAGKYHLLGLKADGTAVAAGANDVNQCSVSGLYDIVDIAAGEYHSVYLRTDGVVSYKGSGNDTYKTNTDLGNLKYKSYVSPTSLSLSLQNGATVAVGASITVTATVLPAAATYVRVIYTSGNIAVASVVAIKDNKISATITGIKEGTVTITARLNGTSVTQSVQITVYKTVALEGIETDSKQYLLTGSTSVLGVRAYPSGAAIPSLSYTSSDSTVVSVNSSGTLTALKEGSAVITAKSGSFTASCTVYVVSSILGISPPTVPAGKYYLYGEKFNPSEYSITVNVSDTLTYTQTLSAEMLFYDETPTFPSNVRSVTVAVTVSYMEKTTVFYVGYYNNITAIEIQTSPRAEYNYGENFEDSSGTLKLHNADGTTSTAPIINTHIKGYRPDLVGIQDVRIEYSDSQISGAATHVIDGLVFTVHDLVQAISYSPVIEVYIYNQEGAGLAPTEEIQITMQSGAIRFLPVTDARIAVSGFDRSIAGNQSITFKYTETVTDYHDMTTSEAAHSYTYGTLKVAISAEYSFTGIDDGTFFYELGGELYIGLVGLQTDGSVLSVTDNAAENIYYAVTTADGAFDKNTIYTVSDPITVILYYKECTTIVGAGGVYTSTYAYAELRWQISVECMNSTKSVTFATDGTNYTYSGGVYYFSYGEDVSIDLKLVYSDDREVTIAPFEIEVDRELVDETQILRARYLSTWLSANIKITDDYVGLQKIKDMTVGYDDPVNFEVYLVKAKSGAVAIPIGQCVVSPYSSKDLGETVVNIEYKVDEKTYTTSFKLTVIDKFKEIKLLSVKREYKYGESFDPTTAVFMLYTQSGDEKTLNYNQYDFYITENFGAASETVIFYYTAEGYRIPAATVEATFKDYVYKISVKANKTEYNYGENIDLTVTVFYKGGTIGDTVITGGYTTDYNKTKVGRNQTVTVSYYDSVSGANVTATCVVSVIDNVSSIKLISSPLRTSYNYGEAISMYGAKVSIVYASGGAASFEGASITSDLYLSYDPTKSGTQTINIRDRAGSEYYCSFAVTFSAKVGSTFKFVSEIAELAGGQIKLVTEGKTVGELFAAVTTADYLTAAYLGRGGQEVTSPLTSARTICSGDRLRVTNAAGTVIFDYPIYIFGDADGDGSFGASDLDAIAEMLLKETQVGAVMDYNGDGKSNLTDLVSWARKANLPEEPASQAAAKTLITDIRGKGKDDEKV